MKKVLFCSMAVLVGAFISFNANADADKQCNTCWAAVPDNKYDSCQTDADCNGVTGAKSARCISVGSKKACAAIECKPGYMMWIHDGKSMGFCHDVDICKRKGRCSNACEHGCAPHYINNLAGINSLIPGVQIKGRAYDYCSCGGLICGDKSCRWDGALAVMCADGKRRVTVPRAFVNDINPEASIDEIKTKVMNKYQDALRQACGGSFVDDASKAELLNNAPSTTNGTVTEAKGEQVIVEEGAAAQQNSAGVGDSGKTNFDAENAARDKLEAFFKSVDSDRSVWKNADGSFNATRLASDLTAGVVLGTVGGVVSGVLIKKSQVEKGFDALNCTVGGQKIADWGDEFSIRLRR